MSNNNTIPDISFQLVFCFLPFRELPLIARCSKEFKRIVTEPLFLNMFRQNEEMNLEQKVNFHNASTSVFRHIIRQMTFFHEPLEHTRFLPHFHHPVFKALGSHLLELKVDTIPQDEDELPLNPPSFCHFQSALSFLTSLTSLYLSNFVDEERFYDMSFLTHMKQLKTFRCDYIDIYLIPIQDLAHNLSFCSELTHLDLFRENDIVHHLPDPQLAGALKQTKLNHLGVFYNVSQDQQYDCAQILNHFSYLKTIGIEIETTMTGATTIPTLLGKWIHNLELSYRTISDKDVLDLISLPHLKSLELYHCVITDLQMKTLIEGLSTKLQDFVVYYSPYLDSVCVKIIFDSLSRCTKLKSLHLSNIGGVKDSEFDSRNNCKLLESISISNTDPWRPRPLNIPSVLKNPSIVFPMLKKVEFN
jgi:hypothetical protein